jgi:hypothetical protein
MQLCFACWNAIVLCVSKGQKSKREHVYNCTRRFWLSCRRDLAATTAPATAASPPRNMSVVAVVLKKLYNWMARRSRMRTFFPPAGKFSLVSATAVDNLPRSRSVNDLDDRTKTFRFAAHRRRRFGCFPDQTDSSRNHQLQPKPSQAGRFLSSRKQFILRVRPPIIGKKSCCTRRLH